MSNSEYLRSVLTNGAEIWGFYDDDREELTQLRWMHEDDLQGFLN
jgi:hypothetical protein